MKLDNYTLRILGLICFFTTRLYIWHNPPQDFSQITYVYMPYAQLWASGELPYLKQWYGYPPLTIPFFYLPHLLDMATNHHWYHVNYATAYKGMMTLIDAAVFGTIWVFLKRIKINNQIGYLSLFYYSLATAKAHHFIYDSFDLIFAAMIMLPVVAMVLWKKYGNFISWVSWWAGVGIKYVNGPLGLPQALSNRLGFKKLVTESVIAGILVWIIPIIIFRSSLLVTLEYHKQRGIQVESTAATMVRTIDQWTHTERFVEIAKAYDIQGPVSERILPVFKILFPLSLITYILFAGKIMWRYRKIDTYIPLSWISLGYISVFMLTSPVLSTPYLLWHIPIVSLLPTKTISEKILLTLTSLMIITAGMTWVPNIQIGPLLSHVWIGWLKIAGFGVIVWRVLAYLLQLRLAK